MYLQFSDHHESWFSRVYCASFIQEVKCSLRAVDEHDILTQYIETEYVSCDSFVDQQLTWKAEEKEFRNITDHISLSTHKHEARALYLSCQACFRSREETWDLAVET